jgi:hypothetical protein
MRSAALRVHVYYGTDGVSNQTLKDCKTIKSVFNTKGYYSTTGMEGSCPHGVVHTLTVGFSMWNYNSKKGSPSRHPEVYTLHKVYTLQLEACARGVVQTIPVGV